MLTLTASALLGVTGVATAQSGGVGPDPGAVDGGPPSMPSQPKVKGKRGMSEPVSVTEVICVQGCLGSRQATPGATIQATGSGFNKAKKILFSGGGKRGIPASFRSVAPDVVQATVPAAAKRGRVFFAGKGNKKLGSSPKPIDVLPANKLRTVTDFVVVEAAANPATASTGSPVKPQLRYWAVGAKPGSVRVQLANASGAIVGSWNVDNVEPNSMKTLDWDGLVNGQPAPEGAYTFKISQNGATTSQSSPPQEKTAPFSLSGTVFPVQGPHDYGGSGAKFGAGRRGHSHQGQDVFAKCGTPLVAPRPGTATFRATQSAAGNYLVIAGDDGQQNYFFAHLRRPAIVAKGTQVAAGQTIGEVGESGNARGCHLHFEIWEGAWQQGGSPIDPLPTLKSWDTG